MPLSVAEGLSDFPALLSLVQDAIALGKSLGGSASLEAEAKAVEDSHLLSRLAALIDAVKAQAKS